MIVVAVNVLKPAWERIPLDGCEKNILLERVKSSFFIRIDIVCNYIRRESANGGRGGGWDRKRARDAF